MENKYVLFDAIFLDELHDGVCLRAEVGIAEVGQHGLEDDIVVDVAHGENVHRIAGDFGIGNERHGGRGVEEIDDVVSKVLDGKYSTEERLMLESENALALNDFVIKGCNTYRASKFYLEINGRFVCDYIADGLIISTPTGSTAYGLSAGGPVLYPTLDAIVIVPVCPHTLNARPLVVPKEEVITVKTGDKLLSVAIDGSETPDCIKQISIKTSANKALLAFLDNDSFYSVLRNKLHWGISPEK